jgi:Carboxypeptidase regulatory-like domain
MRPILALFLLSAAALAQSNFATISGRIEDPSHQPLDRAQVTITAKDTGAVRTLNSNSDGLFEAVNLMPGDYSVEVGASGFVTLTRSVTLEVNQRMGVDFAMELGQRKESVAVTAAAETLKTQDASLGEVVEPRSIRDLPLNGRMLLDLALTVPGAQQGHGAQLGTMNPLYWRPGQASSITVGGRHSAPC